MKQAPHIGNMLREYVKTKRIYQSAWARKQGIQPKNVLEYLKRPNMRIDTMFTICQLLNYDFFKDISAALPPGLPPHVKHESEQQLETLKQENEQLKLQVATLEKALGLVGGR